MSKKSVSASILKGIVYKTAHIHTDPSADRYDQTTSASSTTVIRTTRQIILLGSARAVALVKTHIQTGVRNSSSMDAMEAEKDTAETRTAKIGGWVETTDCYYTGKPLRYHRSYSVVVFQCNNKST